MCGEGGEYETLTLDCPIFLQGRIILDAWDTVNVSEDSMAPVALLHPKDFHVEPKNKNSIDITQNKEYSSSISLEGKNDDLAECLVIQVPDDFLPPVVPVRSTQSMASNSLPTCPVRILRALGTACISLAAEVTGASEIYGNTSQGTTAALTSALQAIATELSNLNLTWHDALFVHLYVPEMAHFAAANAAYSKFFPSINPPSRATVQLAANPEISLIAEVLLRRQNNTPSPLLPYIQEKKVLHVQSISEWAPSCIGPYSQAVAHQGLVFFAGQIPLDPPTMGVATSDPAAATARSLKSCQAVAVAMQTDLRYGSLWWTVYCSAAAGQVGREAAGETLQSFLNNALKDDDDDDQQQSCATLEASAPVERDENHDKAATIEDENVEERQPKRPWSVGY